MAKVFLLSDNEYSEQQMEVYLNDKNKLYINCGDLHNDYFNGYVTLDYKDVCNLIKELNIIKKLM